MRLNYWLKQKDIRWNRWLLSVIKAQVVVSKLLGQSRPYQAKLMIDGTEAGTIEDGEAAIDVITATLEELSHIQHVGQS